MSQVEATAKAGLPFPGTRSRLTVVSALGTAQILAWGSSYYLLAVLAGPIAADTGWSLAWVMGGLSIGLLVSGLVAPRVGHIIEHHGGRPVLASSAILLAVGLLGLGVSPTLPVFIASWVVIGVGMGTGLYDPAFSALGRLYGEEARPAITHVTLFGGFASTICWPVTALLAEQLGWRGTCLVYAAVHLFVVLPLYRFGMPGEVRKAAPVSTAAGAAAAGQVRADQRFAFILLATGFTLASVIMTVIAVHLLTLLQAQGLALAAAVGFGALIGPSQVAGRILEMVCGRKAHPIWTLVSSAVLVVIGLGLLVGAPGIAAASIFLYGMGSGLRSIARGTVPLALFGREGYAILMGRLALPTLLATAVAPILGAWLLDVLGPDGTLVALCGAAIVNLILVLPLVPMALRRRTVPQTS
nr:MFS transporter [uncultured Roseococcus sp.]